MELTLLQKDAIEKTKKWYKAKNTQIFSIHGYAGSGKTTIVEHLIKELELDNNVAYVAYTGKASLVLNQKGCPATTVHRLIYELETYIDNGIPKTRFIKKQYLPSRIKLIVIDESSMISAETLADIASFKVPIVAIGDPEQLPPIESISPLMQQCDVFLDEVHRQAASNPIIKISMMVRAKQDIPYGIYSKDVAVISKKDLRDITLINASQIICGKNATRRSLNDRIRNMLHGENLDRPVVNDKLICLKNNWQLTVEDYPLINGMIGYAKKIKSYDTRKNICKLDFQPDFLDSAYYESIQADFKATKGEEKPTGYNEKDNFFDYGYAITCHKAQGSSFDKVVVFEETLNPKMHSRWLYTAVTRAESKLILVR